MTETGLRTGRDGKQYRATPMTRQERGRAHVLIHFLVHGQGMSIRGAQRVMLAEYGIRRSVGQLASDLAGYQCPDCPGTDE